jgi:hypothetical protein
VGCENEYLLGRFLCFFCENWNCVLVCLSKIELRNLQDLNFGDYWVNLNACRKD